MRCEVNTELCCIENERFRFEYFYFNQHVYVFHHSMNEIFGPYHADMNKIHWPSYTQDIAVPDEMKLFANNSMKMMKIMFMK